MTLKTRVVIVGGGFGGLETALSLRELLKNRVEVTVVDRGPHHIFVPSIHEIVSGRTTAADIQIPLDVVLGPVGIGFVCGEVSTIDLSARQVRARNETLPYDCLVMASGAENHFSGVPGAAEFACPFRSGADAERISAALGEITSTGRGGRIVLAGGGTEGVEVAGELADAVAARTGARSENGPIGIEIIGAKNRLLPEFPEAAGAFAEARLRQKGVRLTLGSPIAAVSSESLTLDSGDARSFSLLIWTGGIRPSKLIGDLPLPKDPGGWLRVTEELRSPGDERVFAVGDTAAPYRGDDPLGLPRLAYHALDQALAASLNIAALVRGTRPVRYEPQGKALLISLGAGDGLYVRGDRIRTGPWVVGLKKMIERRHLMSCLTRALAAPVSSLIPGAGLFHRLRRFLPV